MKKYNGHTKKAAKGNCVFVEHYSIAVPSGNPLWRITVTCYNEHLANLFFERIKQFNDTNTLRLFLLQTEGYKVVEERFPKQGILK